MSLQPFAYPPGYHVRKHGPAGYLDYQDFRPWLRDEFAFRCVYCLWREIWFTTLQIDHFLPKKIHPEIASDYNNLVYACPWCNRRKSTNLVPDPGTVAYADYLKVEEDGRIKGKNDVGRAIVKLLGLATRRQKERRADMIALARFIERHPEDPDCQAQLRRWFGYPRDLPQLDRIAVELNTKPNGVSDSHYARRRRLPLYY